MKIDLFELELEKSGPDDFYLAGEELVGTLELSITEPVRIARLSLRVLGSVETSWYNKAQASSYDCRELVLDEYKDLTSALAEHCSESLEIFRGQHQIRFRVYLPLDLISSIEERENGYGSAKYTCMAVLDVPDIGGDSEIVAESEFHVHSLLNLDAPHFREPTSRREQINVLGFCCGWRRGAKGYVAAEMSVSEMGLLPGESVPLVLRVENTVKKASAKRHPQDGEHECALVSLCQQLDFRSRRRVQLPTSVQQPPQHHPKTADSPAVMARTPPPPHLYGLPNSTMNSTMNSAPSAPSAPSTRAARAAYGYVYDQRSLTTALASIPTCRANVSRRGVDTRCLLFPIPSLLPPTSTKAGGLITCSYFFRLDMGHFDLVVPVVIGSQKTIEAAQTKEEEEEDEGGDGGGEQVPANNNGIVEQKRKKKTKLVEEGDGKNSIANDLHRNHHHSDDGRGGEKNQQAAHNDDDGDSRSSSNAKAAMQ